MNSPDQEKTGFFARRLNTATPLTLFFICLVALCNPNTAFANSLAPLLPFMSAAGWAGLPLIIILEGYLLKRAGVQKPYKLSTYGNLISSLAGLPFAAINIFIWIPAIALDSEIIALMRIGRDAWPLFYWSLAGVIIGIIFNWWLSSNIEYRFAKKSGEWSTAQLPKSLFYKVNAASYGILLICFLWIPIKQFRTLKSPAYAASKIVEFGSARKQIDFSTFYPSEWDEITIWRPYQNICKLGISGYEPNNSNCKSSTDDGETYLIFLKENHVAFIAPYNRGYADFATSKLPDRIKRNSAIFKLSEESKWPKVELDIQAIALRDIQTSHITANVPQNEVDFQAFLKRDLTTYFEKKLMKKNLDIHFEPLRKQPTQSGLAYPKYYLWVQVKDKNGALLTKGSARVAAIDAKEFEVTDYLTAEEIIKNPESIEAIFPKALCDGIISKAKVN